MKKLLNILFLSFFLVVPAAITGCAELDEGGDCASDCSDPDPSCEGDGCDVDPPVGSEVHVCRAGRQAGETYWECNQQKAEYGTESFRNSVPYFVGECPTEGIVDYWDGRVEPDEIVDGWPRIYLRNVTSSNNCGLTIQVCDDPGNVDCWFQYGPRGESNLGATSEEAGPYRECGVRSNVEACGMFFRHVKDDVPEPLDYYPN